MLVKLTAYRIGEPALKPSEAFWIYTNLSKEQLAEVLLLMNQNKVTINEENLIKCIKYISIHPGHDWVKVERIDDSQPVHEVDAKLN